MSQQWKLNKSNVTFFMSLILAKLILINITIHCYDKTPSDSMILPAYICIHIFLGTDYKWHTQYNKMSKNFK